MSAYGCCVLAAFLRALWRLAMPRTMVRIGNEWFVAHEGLDSFCGRWQTAMHARRFFPIGRIWANPAQIVLAVPHSPTLRR